jgi:bifunctional DNA primase/polymerase-like protein
VSAPDVLDVALWLAARHGCHLFRVDHPGRLECAGAHRECDGQRGKHPAGQWSRTASCHPAVIRAMLGGGPWNLGIACKRSGLLVVDEDKPGAFTSFAASIGHVLDPTFTVTTAKGSHFYYRQDQGAPLGNGRGQLAGRGIDIRGGGGGNGGYVVGPASVHQTGIKYVPVDSTAPILPVPGWLAEALRPPVPAPRRPGRPVSTFSRLKSLVKFVLESEEGERNERLYWSSCRAAALVSAGQVDELTATAVLVDAAGRVGLPEQEALRTVASGLKTTGAVRHG